MNNDDEALASAYKKIEREKALLNAANAMRQQTNNESVRSRLDTQMREGRRNIQYFEDKLRELQMRKMGHGMDNMNLGPGDPSGSLGRPQSQGVRNDREGSGPMPPPKDLRGYNEAGSDQGGYGTQQYSEIGGHGDMMPPRHPYAPPGPGQTGLPKSRPHYSKLGMIVLSNICGVVLLIPPPRSDQI
jgi:hypothetical protein